MGDSELSRRDFCRTTALGAFGLVGVGASGSLENFPDQGNAKITPDQSLARLRQGNLAFLAGTARGFAQDRVRRLELAKTQTPFAVLVGCSDSRVPPELLFGSGLGELFIVRNAGNTVDMVAMGSVEYGVLVLGAPLVVVLGHERCGAVKAAVEVVEHQASFPGRIGEMIEPILPAVLKAKSATSATGDALLDAAVRENVRRIVDRLSNSEPSLTKHLRDGSVKIVGARYDLDDGRVEFFKS